MRTTRTTVALAVAAAALVVAAPSADASTAVAVTNFAYTPKTVTISHGSSVTWTNRTSFTSHTVTADSGKYSYSLRPGQSVTRTYNKAGTKHYHCSLHPQMVGTVIVK